MPPFVSPPSPERVVDPRRRRLLAAGALLVPAIAGAALPKVNAGLDPASRDVELRVSVYKGHIANFFEEAGVADVPYALTFMEFPPASNLLIEAVSSNAIDLAGSSNVSPIFVDPDRARFRQISSVVQDANNYVLVVPRNSPLRSVADLRGKNVGFLRSTTPHYFLLKVLQAHGLSPRDIRGVPMLQQDGYAAFKSGQLDAWAVGGLFSTFAVRDGARVLAKGGDVMRACGVTVAADAVLKDSRKRAAAADYLGREKKTLAWIDRHPDAWATKFERISGVPKAVYLEQFKGRSTRADISPVDDVAIREQQDVIDVFVAGGVLTKRADVRRLWDTSFAGALA